MTIELLHGDCGTIELEENSYDGMICDPPYELSSDGKASAIRVALELMLPKRPEVKADLPRTNELPFLIAKIAELVAIGLLPRPTASMPVGSLTLDSETSSREDNVNHVRKGSVRPSESNASFNVETETAEYLGCFALECGDRTSLHKTLDSVGTSYLSGRLGIGLRIDSSSLGPLLTSCGSVILGDENVRTIANSDPAAISTICGTEDYPMASTFSFTRTDLDSLSACSALAFLATLQLGGAEAIRAVPGARGLPSMFEARRIRIVGNATDRALTFDLIFCPQRILSGGFMGKSWDGSKVAYDVGMWKHIYRALKPGAHAMIFGGTRTHHRMAVALEDAGFEVRDTLCWLYGQGMPKSLNVAKAIDKKAGAKREVVGTRTLTGNAALSTQEKGGTYSTNQTTTGLRKEVDITASATDLAKQWDGFGTALKPAVELVYLVRKPLCGTVVENVERYGCGALAIDRSRIGRDAEDQSGWSQSGSKASDNRALSGANYARDPKADADGRWPANVLLDEEAGAMLDAQTGNRKAGYFPAGAKRSKSAIYGDFAGNDQAANQLHDVGGASRFFYCAKSSRAERDRGLSGEVREALFMNGTHRRCQEHPEGAVASGVNHYTCGCAFQYGAERAATQGLNVHPTCKPVALCSYLAGLILPPTEKPRLLVPFSGSGSEILGAREAGWTDITGIEISEEYITIAKQRIAA